MQILEEFWYGNINPSERPFQRQRKFDKAFKMLTKNEEKLLESLNEQEWGDEIHQVAVFDAKRTHGEFNYPKE